MPLDFTDLREMKKRRDVDGLMNVLETGDVRECREAICMLGELRSKKAIVTLIGFLETDDVQIRSNAAWALGQIGHVKAVLPLIGLMNDPIENIRINAAWSLGRIGDARALSVLKYAVKNGSTDLRKHALEAIARIETKGNEKWRNNMDEPDISDTVDIPLIELDIPQGMECNYISRVEDEDSQTDYENMPGFSRDVLLRDTKDPFFEDEKRKIVVGLREGSKGLISVDIIFRYKDGSNGDSKSSSVWLQMSSRDNEGVRTRREIERIDRKPKDAARKNSDTVKRKSRVKQSRKQKIFEHNPEDEINCDVQGDLISEKVEPDTEEIPEERIIRRKFSRRDRRSALHEIPEEETRSEDNGSEIQDQEDINSEPEPVEAAPHKEPVEVIPGINPVEAVQKKEPEAAMPKTETMEAAKRKELEAAMPKTETMEAAKRKEPEAAMPKTDTVDSLQTIVPVGTKPELRHIEEIQQIVPLETKPEIKQTVISQSCPGPASTPDVNVNSAVQLLNDIGMSGMTNAASTVTQLSGEEAESVHAQLRTIPIDEMIDEIKSLGDSIVMIGVELHGVGEAGEVKGEMQMYISGQNALEVANELLCNSSDTAIKDFNDDIISTLKETANIFGGQYVSAISEYIGVPLTLKTPSFNTGNSSIIAESISKNVAGKVEFALATNIQLGNNRTGRLIMLVDPKSFDVIIQKLN